MYTNVSIIKSWQKRKIKLEIRARLSDGEFYLDTFLNFIEINGIQFFKLLSNLLYNGRTC
jgi:hypothetical protein